MRRWWGACLVLIAVAACDMPRDLDVTEPPTQPPRADGSALYASLCASCHGEIGEGGLGPSLQDWSRGHDLLASIIDERMPQGAPERCDAACADAIATYVIASFSSEALSCEEVRPAPRRLRLLTRRELRATVRDLLGIASDDPASCRRHTFEYAPGGRALSSVAVAGSFNDWSPTAWPMTHDAARGVWTLTRELPDGEHSYKLVLDGEEWLADPTNPRGAPDGFGGQNSLLVVACTGASDAIDPADGLPVEARSEGFLFDTDAASAVVTASHVDAMMRASSQALRAIEARIPALLGCAAGASRETCAEGFVERFGRRAFRRPLEPSELARYRALVLGAATNEEGARLAIRAMLVSPAFLYRSEMGERGADGTYVLSPWELASALSYQLWGTTPDDALLDAAASGALGTPQGLEREARRLLADPRARATLGDFATMWLGIGELADATKQSVQFPAWSPALASTMIDATRRFVIEVAFDGTHDVAELITADWRYANQALAEIYGASEVRGDALVRITVPERAGILGEASVLATYAHSDQTSPIRRGLFVRRNLLCQSFAPPPADAGGVPDVDPAATTRERFAQHTREERCASCHRYIDPVGFGFEHFDAIGAWRDREGERAIDARGDLVDVEALGRGTSAPYSSVPELATTLAASDALPACFVRQYYRFARGHRETAADHCAVRALIERYRAHRDVRELMIDVVVAPEFARRREDLGGER